MSKKTKRTKTNQESKQIDKSDLIVSSFYDDNENENINEQEHEQMKNEHEQEHEQHNEQHNEQEHEQNNEHENNDYFNDDFEQIENEKLEKQSLELMKFFELADETGNSFVFYSEIYQDGKRIYAPLITKKSPLDFDNLLNLDKIINANILKISVYDKNIKKSRFFRYEPEFLRNCYFDSESEEEEEEEEEETFLEEEQEQKPEIVQQIPINIEAKNENNDIKILLTNIVRDIEDLKRQRYVQPNQLTHYNQNNDLGTEVDSLGKLATILIKMQQIGQQNNQVVQPVQQKQTNPLDQMEQVFSIIEKIQERFSVPTSEGNTFEKIIEGIKAVSPLLEPVIEKGVDFISNKYSSKKEKEIEPDPQIEEQKKLQAKEQHLKDLKTEIITSIKNNSFSVDQWVNRFKKEYPQWIKALKEENREAKQFFEDIKIFGNGEIGGLMERLTK